MEIKTINGRPATKEDANEMYPLILGRLFRIMSRPFQEGDIEEYYKLRSLALDCAGVLGWNTSTVNSSSSNSPLPGWNFGSGSTGIVE